jgi:hypothetical protein
MLMDIITLFESLEDHSKAQDMDSKSEIIVHESIKTAQQYRPDRIAHVQEFW